MRKLVVVLVIAAFATPAASHAATDVAAAAQGTGTLKYAGATCSAPLAVSINVRSNLAIVTENWGPGNPGIEACTVGALMFQYQADNTPFVPFQHCSDLLAITTGAPFALSQSGSTYTLQSSYRLCSGRQIVEKVVVNVQATRLVYSHTRTDNGTVVSSATGALPRVA